MHGLRSPDSSLLVVALYGLHLVMRGEPTLINAHQSLGHLTVPMDSGSMHRRVVVVLVPKFMFLRWSLVIVLVVAYSQ